MSIFPAARRVLAALSVITVGACAPADDARKVDPNLPAVIQVPIVLPGDTMRSDTIAAYRERMQGAIQQLYPEYSVLAAATVFGDRRMMTAIYASDATLRIADSTYTGGVAVVNAMVTLFSRASVTEMTRQSRALNAVDSIYTDSGSYVMVSKRSGGTATSERGTYVARWRRNAGEPRWTLLYDELKPQLAKR
jgi:hypothetical protein